jgi:hypothetical protein
MSKPKPSPTLYIPYRGHEINPKIFTSEFDDFFDEVWNVQNGFMREMIDLYAGGLHSKSENYKRLVFVKFAIDFEIETLTDKRTKAYRRFNQDGPEFGKYKDYTYELDRLLRII